MNDLNKVMKWTAFILAVVAVIFLLFVPIICLIYFPKTTIAEQFSSTIEYVSIFITFLSAGFGAFSIYQANGSNKQAAQIIKGINQLDTNQQALTSTVAMLGMMFGTGKSKAEKEPKVPEDWPIDPSNE